MSDYERVARLIRYLRQHWERQPSLSELAAEADLSPAHLHRLFQRWAGITPKAFLRAMTLDYARELLRNGQSVLDTALASGLSGPGRLHDLCVTFEAASPGEWKTGGAGWQIIHGTASTPLGDCFLAESPRGICHLAFPHPDDSPLTDLRHLWPAADLTEDPARAALLAERIFTRQPLQAASPLTAHVRGTAFQVRVWRALLRIPPGHAVSYGRIADSIRAPRAARAVGTAVGHNRLAWLIPCHRVLRETGELGGYRWGTERKQALLAWESQLDEE